MAELKTRKTAQSATEFLKAIDDPGRRADCQAIARMMRQDTGNRDSICGTAIVGYGSYDNKNESGREGSWFLTGFSPRKQAISLYIMPGFKRFDSLMTKLGKYKTGKSCLYIKALADVDEDVLQKLITLSVEHMRKIYPAR